MEPASQRPTGNWLVNFQGLMKNLKLENWQNMDRNLSRTARNWPAAGRWPVRSWLEVVKMARAEVGQGPARNCDRWSELLRDRSGAEEPTKKYCIQEQVKWIIAGQEPLATSTRNPGPELQWSMADQKAHFLSVIHRKIKSQWAPCSVEHKVHLL